MSKQQTVQEKAPATQMIRPVRALCTKLRSGSLGSGDTPRSNTGKQIARGLSHSSRNISRGLRGEMKTLPITIGVISLLFGAASCVSFAIPEGEDIRCYGPGPGAITDDDVKGNCMQLLCNENFESSAVLAPDDSDDENPCTVDACAEDGTPIHTLVTELDCYTGPPSTRDVGVCHGGTRLCDASGNLSSTCEGEVLPKPQDCLNGLDNDCNGVNDEQDLPGCCYSNCTDAIFNDAPLCPSSSQVTVDLYQAFMNCVCNEGGACVAECSAAGDFCDTSFPSMACDACMNGSCQEQYWACLDDF